MILRCNLPTVAARARAASYVLDVGGWHSPLNDATHVIDLNPFATRGRTLDPDGTERFTAETWILHDVCLAPWPFPDGYFGFSFCSHLLEDVRDPLAVVRELRRVARAGYVETPSREREIFAKGRWARLAARIGRPPEVGFSHHRWFVEAVQTHLRFSAKTTELLRNPRYYITRADLGRKLHEAESGLGFFWEGDISAEEAVAIEDGEAQQSLRRFRADALTRLR